MFLVSNALAHSALASLTWSLSVEFLMRGSRKQPYTGARALQSGIRRCWSRVRPPDGSAEHRFLSVGVEFKINPVKAPRAARGLDGAAVESNWPVGVELAFKRR